MQHTEHLGDELAVLAGERSVAGCDSIWEDANKTSVFICTPVRQGV
jgi:hypothetical protein